MIKIKHSFITFEGIEGSGKSTQARLLGEFLSQNNIQYLLSREPGGTLAAEKIREILIGDEYQKLTNLTELLLNFAARVEHIDKVIKPALFGKKIVVVDRFIDSTYAYQGTALGVEEDVINKIAAVSLNNFTPEITFLIDVPVEVAFARIKNRSTNNRYEKLGIEFHKKVYQGYELLAKRHKRIIKIDGTKSEEEVAKEIQSFLIA